jgi:hypothetical protein
LRLLALEFLLDHALEEIEVGYENALAALFSALNNFPFAYSSGVSAGAIA